MKIFGRGIFGSRTTLTITPTKESGIFWKPKNAEPILLCDARLSANPLHYLTLRCHDWVLRMPEHLLGCLGALGVDGIVFSPENSSLPYGRGAQLFYEALLPHLEARGTFPHYTPKERIFVEAGPGRFIRFMPSDSPELHYCVQVNYPDVGYTTLEGTLERADLRALCCARPYGRNKFYKLLSKILVHHKTALWFEENDSDEKQQEKLNEIAWHRLLDLLGALLWVTPPGAALSGRIVTRLVGHAADMELAKELTRVGLRQIA